MHLLARTCTGHAAPSANAQIVWPSICLLSSHNMSISSGRALPDTNKTTQSSLKCLHHVSVTWTTATEVQTYTRHVTLENAQCVHAWFTWISHSLIFICSHIQNHSCAVRWIGYWLMAYKSTCTVKTSSNKATASRQLTSYVTALRELAWQKRHICVPEFGNKQWQ